MGLRTWARERLGAVAIAWAQYTCPHDDVETIELSYAAYGRPAPSAIRRRCRQCGLVWTQTLSTKGPA